MYFYFGFIYERDVRVEQKPVVILLWPRYYINYIININYHYGYELLP